VGKVTAFKSSNLSAPAATITGTRQFSQLGAYVSLASYHNNDVIVASSTTAGVLLYVGHVCADFYKMIVWGQASSHF